MTIKFLLKSRVLKNNLKSLKLRVVHSVRGLKRDAICDTGLKINPKYWDKDSERVTDRHSNHQIINEALNEIAYKRNKILTKFEANKLTFEGVVASLRRGGDDTTLEDFIDNQVKELKEDVTYCNYRDKLKGFKKLIGHKGYLKFNDISNEMFVKAHRNATDLQRQKKMSARTYQGYVGTILAVLSLAKFLGVYDSSFEIPRQYKTLKNKRKMSKNKGNTTEDVLKAIGKISTIREWQSVTIWLLKFCLRGFYSADIVKMTKSQIEDRNEHKMGHLLSTYLKDEVYINFWRSKTDFPMFIHIFQNPTMSIISKLKASFVYTHFNREINDKSILADINDNIKIFDYDVKKHYDKHKQLHKKINEKSSSLGLVQKFARKTFNQYADRLELSEAIRKILIGQATDRMLGESYDDNTIQVKLDRVDKAHLDILNLFRVEELWDRLLVKLKALVMKDSLPEWLLYFGSGVSVQGNKVMILKGNPQKKVEWIEVEGKYKSYFKKFEYQLKADDLFPTKEERIKENTLKIFERLANQEKEIKKAETKVFKLKVS